MNRHLTYCIACCARSGSTYLAELCESTGRLGIPREYILDDPAKTVTQVCEFVGVSTKDLPPPRVTTRIQRDAVTDQWKERLLAENADSSDNTSTTATEASDR